jgi:hypothetical protein
MVVYCRVAEVVWGRLMASITGSVTVEQAKELTTARQALAKLVLTWGLVLIGVLAASIVIATVILFYAPCPNCGATDRLTPDHALSFLQTLLTGILPVIASWIAAVIAFYFARENQDAAAQNARDLIQDINPASLASIPVSGAMVPVEKLEVVRIDGPKSDAGTALTNVLSRFQAKGLSRLVFLDQNDIGQGVLHDSVISQFLVSQVQASKAVGAVLVSDLLASPPVKATLVASVVWTTPSATLAQAKLAMDEQTKTSSIDCRDALVTADGSKTGKVVGYISDIDIAKRGVYK